MQISAHTHSSTLATATTLTTYDLLHVRTVTPLLPSALRAALAQLHTVLRDSALQSRWISQLKPTLLGLAWLLMTGKRPTRSGKNKRPLKKANHGARPCNHVGRRKRVPKGFRYQG